MAEEHSLVLVEQPPAEVVIRGKEAAKELTNIVSSRPKKLLLAGKQYLFFEDWQTIGKFYGVTAKVISTEELRDGLDLIGFLAHAVAVAGGVEVSAADAECTIDEPKWSQKPRFQLRSMAQTRACAKALRNCLGWVAVLAGYEATPAEELDGVAPQPTRREPTKSTITPEQKIIAAIALRVQELSMTPKDGKDALLNFAERDNWGNQDEVKERGLIACSETQLTRFLEHLNEPIDAEQLPFEPGDVEPI